MTAIAQALSVALLDFVWQGLLAAFLLWTALIILRNRSPRARYLACCVALAVMAALPVITACLVYTAPAVVGQAALSGGPLGRVPLDSSAALPGPVTATFDSAGWLARWALPAWSLGVLLFSLRLVWASRQISALRRQSKSAEAAVLALVDRLRERMQLARPVRVLISPAGDCPSVVGWIKPVVLLPASTVLGLTPQQLEAVLAHELAHILRYDYLVNMLQTAVETLLFYHPAVWWASARIRQERELCCDDLAVESCGDAICYARALTRLEKLRMTTPSLALSSAGGSLLHRIQRLTGDTSWQRGPSKLPGILALSLGLVCLALNMQWARGQQPDAPPPAPAAAEESGVPNEPGVRVDLGGARLIHRDEVEYPEAAIRKRIQGTVIVEATLDADGAVGDARVLNGPAELRKAALQSVLQWHFTHDEAGSTRQVAIAFQLSAASDALKLADAKREEDLVDSLVRKQLAERMAEQAHDLQSEQSARAAEMQDQARELAALAAKMRLEQSLASAKLKESLLEDSRASQLAALEKSLAELKTNLVDHGTPMFAGRRLKSIQIQGLADASRDDLLAKLPVHVGDALAEDCIQQVQAAVKQFDEHLGLSMLTSRDGQVEIRIAPEPRQ